MIHILKNFLRSSAIRILFGVLACVGVFETTVSAHESARISSSQTASHISLESWAAELTRLFVPQRNYSEVITFLQDVNGRFPSNTALFSLGASNSGEIIQGIRIGNGSIRSLVVATHHGNEYGSTEVAKAFAAAIAENPITNHTVYVIPVLNIPGYNRGSRAEAGLDPNRDYPGPCGTSGPFRLKSTKALADFIQSEGIINSATLHTYMPGVLYPWGISTRDTSTPYDSLFQMLTKAATQESGYAYGNNTELLYPADGTFEDYAYWQHGIWSLLFELGQSHSPSANQIAEMIRVNVPGIRRFLELAPAVRAENHAFAGKCDTTLAKRVREE